MKPYRFICLVFDFDCNQKSHLHFTRRTTDDERRTTDDEGFVPTDWTRPRVDPRGGVNRDARASLS